MSADSSAKKPANKNDDESAVLAKIAELPEPYPSIGQRLHEIILTSAPDLKSRLWYGMPGYAKAKSKPVLCFFRADDTYMTFGLTEKVDFVREEGEAHRLMPCAWFFTELDSATEDAISAIVRKTLS